MNERVQDLIEIACLYDKSIAFIILAHFKITHSCGIHLTPKFFQTAAFQKLWLAVM